MAGAKDLIKSLNSASQNIVSNIKEKEEGLFLFHPNIKIEYNESFQNPFDDCRKIINDCGFDVKLFENIEKMDVSKETKFIIRISNHNNNYVDIDYFKYREACLDFNANEYDLIKENLLKMVGNETLIHKDAVECIVLFLSYLCYFKDEQTKTYNSIGWAMYDGEKIFKYDKIYANKIMSSECHSSYVPALSPENYSVIDKINYAGLLIDMLNYSTAVSVILSASISGIFRAMLPYSKENNLNINIQGERASGKSTISHLAISFWGNPEILEGSFTDTENAMEIIRAERAVMPYILDERLLKIEASTDESKRKTLLISIFKEYEGKVKERVGKQYEENSGKRTYSPIISSSVESMLGIVLEGSDLGQFRRFIELYIEGEDLFDSRETAEYIENVAYTHYGYGIEILIEHIFNEQYEDGNKIQKIYDTYIQIIGDALEQAEKNEKITGLSSSAKRFALILTSYALLMESFSTFYHREASNISKVTDNETKSVRIVHVKKEIVNRQKDIIDYLVQNCVDKMKRVKRAVNVRENIIKFVEKHENLFYQQKQKWDGLGEYLGSLTVTDEYYYIEMKKGSNVGWLLISETEIEENQLKKFAKAISDKFDKIEIEEKVIKLVGDLMEKEFKKFIIKYNTEVTFEDCRGQNGVRLDRLKVARKDFNGVGKEVKEEGDSK